MNVLHAVEPLLAQKTPPSLSKISRLRLTAS